MKLKIIAMMAALFFSANALAAIQITERQARNMDDVQSLGVIYINHNMATEHEAEQALSQMSDAQGAKILSAYPDARTRNQRPASRQRGDIPLTPVRFFASPREGRSEVCAQTQLRIILQTDLPASSQPDLISHSPFDNQE